MYSRSAIKIYNIEQNSEGSKKIGMYLVLKTPVFGTIWEIKKFRFGQMAN